MAERLLCDEKCADIREAQDCLKSGLESGQAGDFIQALEELQRGRELLRGAKSLRLYLQLSNGLAELYCQATLFQACVLLCEQTLTVWGHSPHHFELLQTLFYLSHAHYWLNQDDQGTQQWTSGVKS